MCVIVEQMDPASLAAEKEVLVKKGFPNMSYVWWPGHSIPTWKASIDPVTLITMSLPHISVT